MQRHTVQHVDAIEERELDEDRNADYLRPHPA
jgi:hypothetical protein